MLAIIDKQGSIHLPPAVRQYLGCHTGAHFKLSVTPEGAITLCPVEKHRPLKLNEAGLNKLKEARDAKVVAFPDWFDKELSWARTDSE